MSPTNHLRGLLILALLMPVAAAQVDIIYTNTSSTSGAYKDAISLWDQTGVERPLVQGPETGSVISRPWHLNLMGTDYLYYFDNIVDTIYRGADGNGNGVLESFELQAIWDVVTATGDSFNSPDSVRYFNGQIAMSNDASPGLGLGVWLLTDLNADQDYQDTGESVEIINQGSGSTTVSVQEAGMLVPSSSDDIEAADFLSDGDVIFTDDDDKIWLRWDAATGAVTNFLNYDPAFSTAGTALVANPDFGTILPVPGTVSATAEDLDLVTVDYATDTVFLAVNFEQDEPWIYRGKDLNADGDLNDAGEVTLFFDAGAAGIMAFACDDISFYPGDGGLYVSSEDGETSGGSGTIYRMEDLNADGDALDMGETTVILTVPAGNDPSVFGFNVVPAGTFGASCISFNIGDNGLTTAGGTLTFDFSDIPAANLTGTDIGAVGMSATGAAPLNANGCTIGLTFDLLTQTLIDLDAPCFLIAPLTASPSSTPGFVYGAGLPAGFTVYYVGVILAPGGVFSGSPSRMIVTQ